MKPNEVGSHNEQHLRNTVYNYKRMVPQSFSSVAAIAKGRCRQPKRRNAEYKAGDYVRLSRYRTVFEKGYTPNFTTEIFCIRKVQYNTNPITYLLKDYQNNEISGTVYAEELTRVKYPDDYLVEKVIRKQNGKAYVKWLGFSSAHNEWIPEKDVF